MFTVNEKNYDFRYNIGAIKRIEAALGESLVSVIAKRNANFTFEELEIISANGLIVYGEETRVSRKEAVEAVQAAMETSYVDLTIMVIKAIERDCPFLFQTGLLNT